MVSTPEIRVVGEREESFISCVFLEQEILECNIKNCFGIEFKSLQFNGRAMQYITVSLPIELYQTGRLMLEK